MKKRISFEGENLYYTTTGTGLEVMLVHGFGETGDVWTLQTNTLKENYRLLVPDLPGSGESPYIPNNNPSIDLFADALLQILNNEQIEKVVLIGHSMGGYICLAFAEKYPNRLKALGLFHSSAYADEEEKKIIRKKGIDFIRNNGSKLFLETTIPNLFADTRNPEKNKLLQLADNFSSDALIGYYRAMTERPDRSQIISALSVPFLMIIGERDKAVPFETSLKQTNLAKLAFIYILRNSAHMGMWEETEKVNKILAKFLEQLKGK